MERDGKVWYYHYDGHGNVRLLTDESGVVTDSYLYNAYGNLLVQQGDTANDFLYCGEQYHAATGLYYLRARYMDPATGTFISMDSYQGSIYDPVSLHKYLYANANPVTYIDPTGYYSMTEMSASMGMATILAGVVMIMYPAVVRNIQTSMSTTPNDWRDYVETVPAENISRPWIMTTPANILQEDLIEVFPVCDDLLKTYLLTIVAREVVEDSLIEVFPKTEVERPLIEYASGKAIKVTSNLGNEIDITPSDSHFTVTKNPGYKGTPNSSIDILDSNGNISTRRWYDSNGNAYRDVNRNGGISGGNPVRSAARNGQLSMIELLYQNGAQLDVGDATKNPLFGAICNGHYEVVKFLVEKGIDITAYYPIGQLEKVDAYEYARQLGQNEIADYLKSKREQK